MHLRYFFPVSGFLLSLSLLAGCGVSTIPSPQAISSGSPMVSAAVKGSAFGGQQPLKDSLITVWAAGNTGYGSTATALARTYTDSSGGFGFAPGTYTCPTADTPVYITAQGGDPGIGYANPALMLAAGIGPCSGAPYVNVTINEITTVATAYALAQFFTPALGAGSTDSFGSPADMSGVMAMSNTHTLATLVNVAAGSANASTSTITIESAKINSLASILAACVNSSGKSGACTQLFAATTVAGGTAPADTLQAAVQIARYPYRNVMALYYLSPTIPPFVGLTTMPNDWTLAIGYTSPNFGLSVSGTSASGSSSNIDIDASGHIWFPSTRQGASGIGSFDPTSNTFSGPYLTTLVQPQYLTIDQSGTLWASDMGSTQIGGLNTTSPSSSGTIAIGMPTQAISTSSNNTVYFGYMNSGSYPSSVTLGGSYLGAIAATRATWSGVSEVSNPSTAIMPFGLAGIGNIDVLNSNSGVSSPCSLGIDVNVLGSVIYGTFVQTGSPCQSGGGAVTTGGTDIISIASTFNQICSVALLNCFQPTVPLSQPQGVAVDGAGNLWIANAGNASVSTLSAANTLYPTTSTVAYQHGPGFGGTMTIPYGVAIDRAGNVWISNASCPANGLSCSATSFTLSELVGAAAPTITPLSMQMGGAMSGTKPSEIGAHPAVTPLKLNTGRLGGAASHTALPQNVPVVFRPTGSQ
jgi:streptogramin lyase